MIPGRKPKPAEQRRRAGNAGKRPLPEPVVLGSRLGPREWRRALDVYEALARQGGAHQRSVKHMDLLVAAAAESAGVGVVHYDEDFDRVAAMTGQRMRWVADRGSL